MYDRGEGVAPAERISYPLGIDAPDLCKECYHVNSCGIKFFLFMRLSK